MQMEQFRHSNSRDNEGWTGSFKSKKQAHEEKAGCVEESDEFECEFWKYVLYLIFYWRNHCRW